jgi:DNA-binding NtrC family response regulator
MSQMSATIETGSSNVHVGDEDEQGSLALMIAWCEAEPERLGEVALFEDEGSALILGRGGEDEGGRVVFHRQRPGTIERQPALASPGISREQLRIQRRGGSLHVEQIGRCPLVVKGERVTSAIVLPGETLLLKRQLLLFCTRRPRTLAPLRSADARELPPFGEADAHGIVGESPAAWLLRDRIAWLAQADEHTLLLGRSGSGKELAARAVHALSARARGPFVARNAATIPASLVDAELFGNVKGYPNPGMPERPGLVGAAHGGTLFLDEIGELPVALQANLLRVLDEGGEYHTLGGSSTKRSNFRLIGATNRGASELKHDLAARLVLRLELPDLGERRDDIPLLIRHLLRRAADKSPAAMARFLEPRADGSKAPRIEARLVDELLRIRLSTNVRELDAALFRAMSASPGEVITFREEVLPKEQGATSEPAPSSEPSREPARELPGEAEIRAALSASGGNVVRAADALGLGSRYVLYRLMRKLGIETDAARGSG